MSTLPIEAILIDFDEEIEYDQDQAINYPAVVPTVNFMLQNTPELIAVADALCRHSGRNCCNNGMRVLRRKSESGMSAIVSDVR